MNFFIDSENTLIGKAVQLDKIWNSLLFKMISFFIWLFGLISFLLIIDYYAVQYLDSSIQLIGLAFVILAIFLFYLAERSFYFDKIKHPRLLTLEQTKQAVDKNEHINLFEIFSFESAKVFMELPKGVESNTSDLAKGLLFSDDMNFILLRLGISPNELNKYLHGAEGSKGLNQTISFALQIAIAEGHHQIEVGDIFIALCKTEDNLKKLLKDFKIDLEDLANLVYWQTYIERKVFYEKQFLNPNRLRLTGGIGRDWAFGWTPFLKRFSVDLTDNIEREGLSLELVGHEKEINEIKEALMRQNGGNAIVVGEPGVGKKTTILGFAKKVLNGETYSGLDFQHVIQIDIDYLMAGASSPGEITQRVSGILNEVSGAGNIIIYIENIQNLLSSGDAGKIDATEVLLPFLDIPTVHLLATCDVKSFNQYVASNTSLMQRFTRVNVEEPDSREMIRILEDTIPMIEQKTNSIITYEAIKQTIIDADKFILNIPNPEKSINLLDSIATHAVSERGKTIILPKDVDSYITLKYQVPAGEADTKEKEKLLNLDSILHQSVIGQNEAINAISNALRRARAGVTDSKKPIGTFLFLGPTGVGKTETAKALSKAYFGSEEAMIRFDMSEFQNKEDIFRLIGGNPTGESIQGLLTTAVREKPFSLLLFDEIEKAHSDILDLFLQLLDEGIVTDGFGRKVSFSNTIVIATSNAGSNLIRESIQSGQQYELLKKQLLDYLQKENIYRPEFLNRFTSIIAFSPLSQAEIFKIAILLIEKLKTVLLKNKGIQIAVDQQAVAKLAALGYDPQMGARPMQRIIQEKIENLLATKILSNELQKGDSYMVTAQDIV